MYVLCLVFFFQAEDGIRDGHVTGVQTCALPITSESSEYLRVCGDSEAVPLPVPEGASGELKFRTNRNYVVLNELSTGNSWMIEDALILVDNWDDLTPPTEEQEEIGSASRRKEE